MTIDDAIVYAEELARNAGQSLDMATSDVKVFGRLCADALHLEKQKEEENGLCVPDTWQDPMQREYRETKDRYERLHWMVTKYEAGVLEYTPKCSIELLKQQKKHMGEYLHDLEVGAFVEGVEL